MLSQTAFAQSVSLIDKLWLSLCLSLYLSIDQSACRPPSCLWFPDSGLFSIWVFPLFSLALLSELFLPLCLICIYAFSVFVYVTSLPSSLWFGGTILRLGVWFWSCSDESIRGGSGPELLCFQASFSAFFHPGILTLGISQIILEHLSARYDPSVNSAARNLSPPGLIGT